MKRFQSQLIIWFITTLLFVLTDSASHSSLSSPSSAAGQQFPQLVASTCTKLQHEVQKAIILHKWGLDNLKFQQRLKRHPKFIVTIQVVQPQHEPLVELKCPGGSGPHFKDTPNLEFYFHETRFQAESVRLFDIHSIFPIHTGSMSVKIKLDPLVVNMDKLSDVVGNGQLPSIHEAVYFTSPPKISDYAKEHREDDSGASSHHHDDSVLDLEREIEQVFLNRIQPDIQKQIKNLVFATVRKYFAQNLIRF